MTKFSRCLAIFLPFSFMFLFGLFSEETQTVPALPPEDNTSQVLDERFYAEFFKMLAMLGLILVFLFLIAWFFKRMLNSRIQQMNEGSLIQISEKRYLSPKTTLYVLNIQNKRVVVAEFQNGFSAVTELPSQPSDFAELMNSNKKSISED